MPDREKVISELDKIADEANPWKESPPLRCDLPYPLLLDAIALLKEQSQIVRCKDCKHYKDNRCFFTMRRHGLHDDWFCADGERRLDDG